MLDRQVPSFYNGVEGRKAMIEKILENIINEMTPHLKTDQLEHLTNVLYVNFHGKEIQEEDTALTNTGINGDEAKIRMFVASKKAVKA